jgi:hypothetical protein
LRYRPPRIALSIAASVSASTPDTEKRGDEYILWELDFGAVWPDFIGYFAPLSNTGVVLLGNTVRECSRLGTGAQHLFSYDVTPSACAACLAPVPPEWRAAQMPTD